LLDHWRDRIDRGQQGLIWVPTCALFNDEHNTPTHGRCFRQAIDLPQDDIDDEVFILPQSDDIEEDEYDSNDDEQPSYRSSPVHRPFEEEVMDPSNASLLHESSSGEYCILFFDLCASHIFYL
jgi:hypothetical protein